MKKDQEIITDFDKKKAINAIKLVEASLKDIKPFDPERIYTPKQREPYDALSDRFTRAVEVSLKFFKSYEKLVEGENSDTLRDLLNRMEKLDLITSAIRWLEMRDIRNRIVHDYLPEKVKKIYDSIMGELGKELFRLKKKIINIT